MLLLSAESYTTEVIEMTDQQWEDVIRHLPLTDLAQLERIVSFLEAGLPVTSFAPEEADEFS